MIDQKKRRVFIHAHIPKTGGNTLKYIFKSNFGHGYMRGRTLISSFQFGSEYTAKGIQERPFLRAFSAHHISLDLPYEMEDVEVIGLSFVRDPAAHFISHYFAHRHLFVKSTVPETRSMNFREYLEKSLMTGRQSAYVDGQVKFLSGQKILAGKKNFIKNDVIDDFSLGSLVELIKQRKAFVFPLSRFDEACMVLERIFPEDFKDCFYPKRINASPRDQIVTEEDRGLIAKHVGKLDFQLLEAANMLLDELIEDNIGNQDELEAALKIFERSSRAPQPREKILRFANSVAKKSNTFGFRRSKRK